MHQTSLFYWDLGAPTSIQKRKQFVKNKTGKKNAACIRNYQIKNWEAKTSIEVEKMETSQIIRVSFELCCILSLKKRGQKKRKKKYKKGGKEKEMKWKQPKSNHANPSKFRPRVAERRKARGMQMKNSDNCPDIYRILRTIPDNNKVQQRREFWNPL